MKRRDVLIGTGTIAVATLASFIPGARSQTQTGNLESVDVSALEHTRKLSDGRDITLTILLPKGSAANVNPAADAFFKDTGVKFNLVEAPVDEINSQMTIDSLTNTNTFDLALPATFGIPDLISAGVLANLDEFARKYEPPGFQDDALFSLGDYHKGSFYGYQTDGDAYLMFYNKSWLENSDNAERFESQHGYPLAIPQTWPELDAQMAFFQRPEEKMYGGALYRTAYYIPWEFWVRFHAKGFWPFDSNLKPQINNAAGQEALTELIAASHNLYPAAGSNGLFENWEAFAEGNIYCNIGWGGTQKFLNGDKSKIKGNLLFGPTPGGIVNGNLIELPYFNWGWNYTVSSKSSNIELAYLFSLFACSPKMSTLAVRETGGYFDPFRSAHYEDAEIEKAYSAEFLDAHQSSMAKSIPDLYLPGQGEYFDALRQNLVLADQGKLEVSRALDLTAQQWEQTTRRLGRQSQAEQWQYLRDSYPETVKTALGTN